MENFQQVHLRKTKFVNSQVSSVIFDDSSDLLWVGDHKGRATSYSGAALTAYTSYVGASNSTIYQFMNHSRGILSLGKDSVKLTSRHAFPHFIASPSTPSLDLKSPKDFKNFKAMCYGTSGQSSVILGGESNSKLVELDLNKLKVNSTIPYEPKVSVLKSTNKHLVVGNTSGSLDIIDPSSNSSIIKNFQAHQVSFSKVDIQNYTLATTGYSKRHSYGSMYLVDPLINVYDLRYLKPLAPVSFPAGASFVSLHPKLPNMCFACSATGQLQFVDLFNINNFKIYQVNLLQNHPAGNPALLSNNAHGNNPRIVKMELSNSGDYLAFADNYSTIYLWSADTSAHFNTYSKSLDYPVGLDLNELKANTFNVDDLSQPLNIVGMPYYKETLLSNWPADHKFKVGGLPKKIPSDLIRNAQHTKRGSLAAGFQRERTTEVDLCFADYNRSKYGKRNQFQQWYSLDAKDKKDNVPRFISEKLDGEESSSSESEGDDENENEQKTSNKIKDTKLSQIFNYKPSESAPLKIPPAFSKLHILYSRFGIEDFDFKFYNKSKKKFSGLEIDIENSYSNSLLILYRFVPEFYSWITQALAEDPLIYDAHPESALNEYAIASKADMLVGKSILAELGYLFDMMANSKGKNCRTTNFQNVLCSIPEARQLGLIDTSLKSGNIPLTVLRKYDTSANCNGLTGANNSNINNNNAEGEASTDGDDEFDKLKNLIHSFNRFLLQRLSFDERKLLYTKKIKEAQVQNQEHPYFSKPSFNDMRSANLDKIVGINLETEVKSTSCSNLTKRINMLYSLDVKCLGIADQKHPLGSSASSLAASPSLYGSVKINSKGYPSNSFKGKGGSKYLNDNNSAFLYNQSILPYIDAAMNNHFLNPIKAWCDDCHRYQVMDTIKTVRTLPHILSLNLNLDEDQELIRKTSANQVKENESNNKRRLPHHWLVNEFYARLSNSSQRPILKLSYSDFNKKGRSSSSSDSQSNSSQDDIRQINSSESTIMTTTPTGKRKNSNEIIKYELVGYVCEISGSDENNPLEDKHLVTFVKVKNPNKILTKNQSSHQWYLFNDFLIIPIEESEVFNLSYWWKKPLIVLYQSNKASDEFQYKIDKSKLNTEILYRDYFAHGTREGKRIEYELLTREEAPKPGTIVALDAEFVIIESDKYEIRSDGTKVLIKPKTQSLARVSVVRGNDGPKKGVPFIDDYVVIEDQVEDYITSYSGIEKEDLDPYLSNKTLTYREVAYRKLWLLLQMGVIFVGHGLTNDFRTINIQVPPDQVRDTLNLYHKKDVKRYLGLKFLMYAALGKTVQSGNHDSIEDARSALELYDKFQELVKENRFKSELDRIYREGAKSGFRVPGT